VDFNNTLDLRFYLWQNRQPFYQNV